MVDASRSSRPDGRQGVVRGLVPVLGLVPLAGLLAACGGGGGGSSVPGGTGEPLFVVAATPTNGQETLGDLSDPELDNRITLTFSNLPREKDMIDSANAFNSLTPNVQVFDHNFARVQGTPQLDPLTRRFSFTPASSTLPNAQYTVNVAAHVRSVDGGEMGDGKDFTTSFTVGQDQYPPVVRNISPAPLQNDTPLFTPTIITFNESLDSTSVVLGQTVFVQDGGTNPPTPINGTLRLERNGFDMVFYPDPCTGYPPATTVVVRLVGTGFDQNACTPSNPPLAFLPNTSFIRDRVGNGLLGDLCNTAGEVSFQFNTKGVKPLPNPCIVPHPGSPLINLGGDAIYASTFNRLFALDVTPVLIDNLFNGTFRPELTQQVLSVNNGLINWCTVPVTIGTFPYGGDFETRVERAGEAVIDYRVNAADLQSYIYMVDEANDAVLIINSGTGKIEGRFKGVGTPRGIGLAVSTGAAPTLFATNFGQGTVTGIPLNTIQPGTPICTAVQELNDDVSRRVYLATGRNPSSVSMEWFGSSFGAVTNQGDNTVTMFNPTTLGTTGGERSMNYQVGESPHDVVWGVPTNVGLFAFIANQGGATDVDGSVSLWWSGSGGLNAFTFNSGSILSTFQDSINTPGRLHGINGTLLCSVPNSASNTVTTLQVTTQGGGLFATIQPVVNRVDTVGNNPVKETLEARFGRIFYVALAGQGQVAIYEGQATASPPALLNLPGVRNVFSIYDQ